MPASVPSTVTYTGAPSSANAGTWVTVTTVGPEEKSATFALAGVKAALAAVLAADVAAVIFAQPVSVSAAVMAISVKRLIMLRRLPIVCFCAPANIITDKDIEMNVML